MAKYGYDQNRPNAHRRGYSTKWDNARRAWLRGKWCLKCGDEATDVHHDPPHCGDMRKFWDRRTWRPMCGDCHKRIELEVRTGKPIRARVRIDPATGLPLAGQEHEWSERR